MTDPPRPIRLAIIGVGKIARDQHLPAIAAHSRFELVATASLHGRIDRIPAYETIEQMLAAGHDLDAVSICTPPVGRVPTATAAFDAGLDVLVEKPPAATLAEIEALKRRAHAAGAVLFTAWHSREAAGVAGARQWLLNRKVEQARISWREDIRRWHPGQEWILAPGGFGVFDPGINALSIATAILPEPIFVESCELGVPSNRDSPLAASLRMRSGSASITAEFDFLHKGQQQWDIVVNTDAGQLSLHDGGRVLDIAGSVVEGVDQEYPRLYGRFAKLIGARESDVDTTPLQLVADAFLLGSHRTIPNFAW